MNLQNLEIGNFIPLAVFGAIAAGAWLLLDWFGASKPRAEERLDDLRDPNARKRRVSAGVRGRASEAMSKMFEKATPALAAPLLPKNAKEASKLKLKLSYAGFRSESAPAIFLGVKFVLLLVGLFLGGGSVLLFTGLTQAGITKAILVAGGLFYLPELAIKFLASRRKEAIFLGLPDALDLMVVCVEAGLGLDQAMRKVAEEMKKSFREIADEFSLCNLHLQMGKARSDVLQDLGNRTGVDDLRSLAAILIQADKFGSSIAQALRVQSDSMRTRRRQLAEEKASKTAVKLIFPLVIFIFPGIFVVLVGPAAITMIREMFPKMQGHG